MAFKIEGVVAADGKSSTGDRDSVKTVETQQMIDVSDMPSITNIVNTTNTMACQPVPEMVDNAMMQEEYDQYNEDPNFNNKQREYYNQRFGGLRNRRVLETHSKSLEEAPSYYRDLEAREAEEWEHR